jgi:hypothetical protein
MGDGFAAGGGLLLKSLEGVEGAVLDRGVAQLKIAKRKNRAKTTNRFLPFIMLILSYPVTQIYSSSSSSSCGVGTGLVLAGGVGTLL